MKTLTWTKRMGIGTGIALASIFAVPNVAGAASTTTCYTGLYAAHRFAQYRAAAVAAEPRRGADGRGDHHRQRLVDAALHRSRHR